VSASVISIAEWRAARRASADSAWIPAEQPRASLRLVTADDTPPPFRLEVFLRRARAVMDESRDQRRLAYPDAEPA
jgi:hypothetical protein